jgi:hypothetical protein
MGRANAVAIVALLVFLSVIIFSPLIYYAVRYNNLALAATVGLLALPIVFILVACAALVASRRPAAVAHSNPKKYKWEKIFAERKAKAERRSRPERVPVQEKPRGRSFYDAVILVAVLIFAFVLLIILSPAVNHVIGPDSATNATKKVSNSSQQINQPNFTNVNVTKYIPNVLVNPPQSLGNDIAVGFLTLLLIAAGFYYAHEASLEGTGSWLSGWVSAGWAFAIRLAPFVVAAAVIALAYIFRKKLHLQAIITLVWDFLRVYRLYIVAGVAVLLVILGIQIFFERRKKPTEAA